MGITYYSVFKNSNGDVGVGTISPTAQSGYRFLQVNGSTSAIIEATVGGTRIGGFDSTASALYVGSIGSYPVIFRTAVDEKMRISANGNVGIGTTSPSTPLHVFNTAATLATFTRDLATDVGFSIGADSNGTIFSTAGAHAYLFYTNGTEKIRINSDGNVGIGTSDPTGGGIVGSKFTIQQADDATAIAVINGGRRFALNGKSNGSFTLFDGGSSTWNSGITQLNGSVGIGTTSPSVKLTVSGDVTDSDVGQFRAVGSTSAAKMINVGYHTTSNYGFISALIAGTGYSALSLQPNGGNVGIATVSPDVRLHVINGTTKLNKNNYKTTTAYSTADLVLGDDISSRTGYAGNGSNLVLHANGTTSITFLDQTRNLGEITYSNRLFTIGGDIGWGTASVSFPGTVNFGTNIYHSIGGQKFFAGSGGNYAYIYTGGVALNFLNSTDTSTLMTVLNGGNVGIGTTSPSGKLEVRTNAASTYVFSGTSTSGYTTSFTMDDTASYIGHDSSVRSLIFRTNSASRLTIQGDGNVGIGTTSPGCKLVIVGETQILSSSAYNTHLNYNDAGSNFITTANSGSTFFRGSSNGITTMTVVGNGNVGIGTTTVRANLHLNGDFIRDSNIPYSWGTSAPFRTFSGAYSYANGGVNGPNRYLLLWPQITSTNGQNGRFVNARLIVARGATHAFNDTTIGDIVATAGYNSSANLYSYTPLIGEKLYFYNVVYNSVTYLAISLPISDFRWELSGHFGIEETAYYSPTFVYSNTSGVGTITQLTTYTNESLAIYNNGGNIGINTTTPTYKLDVNGSINTNSFMYISYQYGDAYPLQLIGSNFLKANSNYYGLLIRSGDTNFISGRLSLIGGSSKRLEIYGYEETIGYIPTVIPGGNVGIGTTSPSQLLEVAGSSPIIRVLATSGNATLRLTDNGVRNWDFKVVDTSDYFEVGGTNLTSLVVKGDGNVGIGVTSPGAKLDIDGNVYIRSGSGLYSNLIGPYTGDLTFYASGSEQMRISGGNIGIGTTSPTCKLYVSGASSSAIGTFEGGSGDWSVTIPGTTTGTIHLDPGSSLNHYGNAITFGASDSGSGANAQAGIYIRSDDTYGTKMYFATTDAYVSGAKMRMMIDHVGNVGIGTSSPSQKLEVVGGEIKAGRVDSNEEGGQVSFGRASDNATGWYIDVYGSTSTPQLRFIDVSNSSVRMVIDASGNIGIGTASPTTKLEVVGAMAAFINGSDSISRTLYLANGANTRAFNFQLNSGGTSLDLWSYNSSNAWQNNVSFNYNGNVGIGVTPSYKLDVNGNVHATSFPTSSDVRFKKNITPLENSLEKIKKLQGVKYEWNEFINSRRDGYELNVPIIGLVAQDVEKVVPEIVGSWKLSDDCQDARSIDYPRLIPLLIEAIKEQQNQIDELKNEIKSLKSN